MDTRIHTRIRFRAASPGFSLIEICAVLLSVSVLMAASVAVFKHSMQASTRLESNTNLKNYGQQAANILKLHLEQSRTIFQNDAYGTGLWARIDFGGVSPIGTTALPTVEETGSLSPGNAGDPTTPFDSAAVGNALFFTESVGHATVSGTWVDLYQPRAYYISKSDSVKIGGQTYGLKLVEWIGKAYPDYSELSQYPASVAQGLASQGYTEAWNSLGTTVGTTVYSISGSGALTAVTTPTLSSTSIRNATRLFQNAGETKYAMAFNTSKVKLADVVPSFGVGNTAGDGFPNGFEVAVVGPTGGRKTLVRLVLMAEGYGGSYSSATEVIASARNF